MPAARAPRRRPASRGRPGLQVEVLASLALVMATATLVLAAMLARTHERSLSRVAGLAARALVHEARSPARPEGAGASGARWWTVAPGGQVRPRGDHLEDLDGAARDLASHARELGKPVLVPGMPWEPLRFAVPVSEEGVVVVGRLPAAVSPALLLALLSADVLVFTAFGAFLLRRRLVRPLERLAGAARSIAAGDAEARAPVDGPAETVALATAFNEMTDSLARRSEALEKAVAELRASNRSLREARAGLDRAERLAAVGRLAAGVAHEVGNPMGAMLAFLDLVGRDAGLSETGRSHLARAAREGARVRTILRQLLDFSRPRRGRPVAVDLARACEDAAALVRAQRRYARIGIEIYRQGDPPAALADPDAVSQILLNLLLNAADALTLGGAASGPGPAIRVTIRPAASSVRAGEAEGQALRRRRPDAVECEVADNGPGVAEEDRERIFDPFFSTKAPGEGTGLGLSNAARFAEEAGGRLVLAETPPASGAIFVLRLPASVDAEAPGGPGPEGVREAGSGAADLQSAGAAGAVGGSEDATSSSKACTVRAPSESSTATSTG